MRPAGHDNGTCLGLIAERRITMPHYFTKPKVTEGTNGA